MFRHIPGTAMLAALFISTVAFAETINTDPIIVTTTRFTDHEARIPVSISVITQKDIESIPAVNIPDLLGTLTGIGVTPYYGNEGLDASIDMRGFGDGGASNSLILLDGQRLNTIDSSSIQWSTVPMRAIERIEVIRGAGSVLFGDRATGGVVNLITNKSGQPHANVTATLGSYDYRSVDGALTSGGELGYLSAFLHASASSGWRDNAQSNQLSLSGRGALNLPQSGEAFVDYAAYRNDYGLPGSIRSQMFRDHPKRARTPDDTQEKEGYRLRPGVALTLSDTLDLNAELAFAGEDQYSDNVSFASKLDRNVRTVSLTPRLRWRHGLGALQSETTTGLDYYHGEVTSDSSAYAAQSARQISRAIYLQNTTALNEHWSVTLGGRSQSMQQQAHQDAYPPYFMPAFSGSSSRTRSIYDLGVHYETDTWSVYGKTGTSSRFANTDELFGWDNVNYVPVFGGDVRPQHARNNEIGGYLHTSTVNGQISLYCMEVKDEIGYDGNSGANVNFDPTRHQGAEMDLAWHIDRHWSARLAYTYTDARFRSGPYDGKQLPMVAANKATTQLGWNSHALGNYTAQVNYVDRRHVSGDYLNVRRELPAHVTVDLRAAWDFKPFQVSFTALNLLDKRYATWGLYYSDFFNPAKSDYYYFPADGRTAFVSLKYDFR